MPGERHGEDDPDELEQGRAGEDGEDDDQGMEPDAAADYAGCHQVVEADVAGHEDAQDDKDAAEGSTGNGHDERDDD